MKFRLRNIILSVVVVPIVIAGVSIAHDLYVGALYQVYDSPSKKYRLVVHEFPRLMTVPGDAGSGPGYVELLDRKGKRLGKADLTSVLDLSDKANIHWYEGGVSSPGNFIFELPAEVK